MRPSRATRHGSARAPRDRRRERHDRDGPPARRVRPSAACSWLRRAGRERRGPSASYAEPVQAPIRRTKNRRGPRPRRQSRASPTRSMHALEQPAPAHGPGPAPELPCRRPTPLTEKKMISARPIGQFRGHKAQPGPATAPAASQSSRWVAHGRATMPGRTSKASASSTRPPTGGGSRTHPAAPATPPGSPSPRVVSRPALNRRRPRRITQLDGAPPRAEPRRR